PAATSDPVPKGTCAVVSQMFGRRPAFEWLRCCEQGGAIQPRKKTEYGTAAFPVNPYFRRPHILCSRYGEGFVTVVAAMRLHVARVEARAAIARGQRRMGMRGEQWVGGLGAAAGIERSSGSKDERWTCRADEGPVRLLCESGVLGSF